MGPLRVIDAGSVSAVRSQSLWHGIASAMRDGDPPTLSFCRPSQPYVCLGFHRRLDEVDLGTCRAEGMPVLRRQIGGGPVYLDSEQLFFQLTMPARSAPKRVDSLYRQLLEPAARAFRSLGLDARIDGPNDIAVGERKLSGTGAGQIGEGVTVVGNVMRRFPHERMARLLALPSEAMRSEVRRLMRRHVSSLVGEGLAGVDLGDARSALASTYSEAFGGRAEPASPAAREVAEIERWDRRLRDPSWLAGPDLPKRPGRQVKVRSGVWVSFGRSRGLTAMLSVAGGRVERLAVEAAHLNGGAAAIGAAAIGAAPDAAELRARLRPFGEDGTNVLRAIEPGLILR